jgi:stress response protein SCP2
MQTVPHVLSMEKDEDQEVTVSNLYVGVGWKTTGGGKKGILGKVRKLLGTDLDVWVIGLDKDTTVRAMAWHDDRDFYENGSLVVSEDNTTGKGPGDDEFIVANLPQIPLQVRSLVFGVAAYKDGVTFNNIGSVTTRIVDHGTAPPKELGVSTLDMNAKFTAVALCKVTRADSGLWTFKATETFGYGKSRDQLTQLAQRV